jgi:hypothetical protein
MAALSSSGNVSTLLLQFQGTASQLTGQMQVSGDPAFDSATAFSGTGSVDTTGMVSFSGTQGAETLAVSGTPSTDGSSLTGTYTASGTTSESGNVVASRPPNMAGTYTANYTDAYGFGVTVGAQLTLTAGTPASGSFSTPITGTATATSPSLSFCTGDANTTSMQFGFTGTQSGAGLTGILTNGSVAWGMLVGTLSAEGTALNGNMTVIDPNAGLCSGMSFNGIVTDPSKPAQPTPAPLGQDGTFTVYNSGPDAGTAYINGQAVTCPAVPKDVKPVSCGTVTIPKGTTGYIQMSAAATAASDYATIDCQTAEGGSTGIPYPGAYAQCTWPVVPIEDIAKLPGDKINVEVDVSFAQSRLAGEYNLSGSIDGTSTFTIVGQLTIYLNGTQIYQTTGSSTTQPGLTIHANPGDQLTFGFNETQSMSDLYLTCVVDRSYPGGHVIAYPAFNQGTGAGVNMAAPFTIPYMPGCFGQ